MAFVPIGTCTALKILRHMHLAALRAEPRICR